MVHLCEGPVNAEPYLQVQEQHLLLSPNSTPAARLQTDLRTGHTFTASICSLMKPKYNKTDAEINTKETSGFSSEGTA